jgi:hypothetical protein
MVNTACLVGFNLYGSVITQLRMVKKLKKIKTEGIERGKS